MLLTALLVTVAAFIVALAITSVVRQRALSRGELEQVNARSSHVVPTPSSGGIGIATGGTLVTLAIAYLQPWVGMPVAIAGILIAILGYVDDRRHIPARWRLGAQIILVGVVVSVLPLDVLSTALGIAMPDMVLFVLLVIAGAFWLNLFNFMDGIDGLAASEAIFLLLALTLLPFLISPAVMIHPSFWWPVGVAAACGGFLVLNWPPAKIFMGDVGSTWLGLMLTFFALLGLVMGSVNLPQLLILPAAFLADALTTLGRRLARGERVYEAHRRHAYQLLALRFGSHRKVTLLYMAINVVVLLPLTWHARDLGAVGWLVALAVYAVLVPAAWWAGAGRPLDPQSDEERPEPDNRQ
ncbi:MraY family glycosyltransferase [Devosia sp.]|uniref:MraY family glycosyltransferase n=1 Tax=Devosia sp. TaxID=1871048 RepID=UPI003A9327CD